MQLVTQSTAPPVNWRKHLADAERDMPPMERRLAVTPSEDAAYSFVDFESDEFFYKAESLGWDFHRLYGGPDGAGYDMLATAMAICGKRCSDALWASLDRPRADSDRLLVDVMDEATRYDWDAPPEVLAELETLRGISATNAAKRKAADKVRDATVFARVDRFHALDEVAYGDWLDAGKPRGRARKHVRWMERDLCEEVALAAIDKRKSPPMPAPSLHIVPAEPAAPKPPRYLFETIGDLRKLPAAKWLVEGWFPEQGVGLIYGEYASGKSFIGFDLLLHLVYGLAKWHGVNLPGVPCEVLLIAREGATGFRGRIDAFKAHHGITDDTDRIMFMRSPVNFGEVAGFEELKAAIKATGKQFKVVLVDTVGRALPGEDFYDPKSITRFMEHLQQIGEISNGVAIGVHHVNKSGDVFGSVYFGASSDFMFLVERDGDPKKDPLRRGKITCTKMKDGEDGWKRRVDYQKAEDSLVVASVAEGGGMLGETKKLSDDDNLAFQALSDALKAVGKMRPQMPGRTVTIDEWLEQCFKSGGVDPTAAKPKRDLHRRQVKLLVNNMIIVQDQLVRIIHQAATT
jgi:hypothetical protein